jgi:predicted enzyme related to lactoylglutathione lyase
LDEKERRMSYRYGKFTWFEHVSADPGKAAQFYAGLFGWAVKPVGMGAGTYDMICSGDAGIGGFVREAAQPAHWASWISVPDVDAAYSNALAAGANAVAPPADYADIGRGATFVDPTGARICIWHSRQGDREDSDEAAVGDWTWNELSTPDPAKAIAFYESVFGYTHQEMDMGEHGKYHVLHTSDGRARGGVMKLPHADATPMWRPYVRVEDADAVASRVAPAGGMLLMPPADIPDVGRIGMLLDPMGAAVGFIKPAVKP